MKDEIENHRLIMVASKTNKMNRIEKRKRGAKNSVRERSEGVETNVQAHEAKRSR